MAYYFITASIDASIYLQQPNQNTGLDEILEVSKVYYGNIKDVSRVLIKFNFDRLNGLINADQVRLDEVNLLLKEAESNEIPINYSILVHPVSQSWEMGVGSRFDNITTEGVTWKYREGGDRIDWLNGIEFETGSEGFPNDGTGGTWYTLVSSSQSFEYLTSDLNINVKNIVNEWLSGSFPNDGFIIKYPTELEGFATEEGQSVFDTNDYGQLKFFSKETNTIYQPKIRIGWDDQSYQTGSLSILNSENPIVRIKNFKSEYRVNTVNLFRISARDIYPLKTFSNSFPYDDILALPQTSYYQIKDYASDDTIIPFSDYSKISCDENGNYLKIDFTNWESDRVYKIEFKIINEGIEYYFDNNYTFKLIK